MEQWVSRYSSMMDASFVNIIDHLRPLQAVETIPDPEVLENQEHPGVSPAPGNIIE